MKRIHKIAAEIFRYSYDNYLDHLGVNERFDRLMPRSAEILETAIKERWPSEKIAKVLDVPEEDADILIENTREALEIVDAENPADSFRSAVRQSIQSALEDGLDSKESIKELVTQICYRASDLSILLDEEGHNLSQYSRHLRREPDCEYYEGYFDEPFMDDSKKT